MTKIKATNITWHEGHVGPEEREKLLNQKGALIWMTGLSGSGKSSIAYTLEHALVQRGFSVLFTPTFRLVQELLAAKRDLALPRALQKLCAAVPEDLTEALIDPQPGAVRSDIGDADGGVLERTAKTGLAFAQRVLGFLARRDVEVEADP